MIYYNQYYAQKTEKCKFTPAVLEHVRVSERLQLVQATLIENAGTQCILVS